MIKSSYKKACFISSCSQIMFFVFLPWGDGGGLAVWKYFRVLEVDCIVLLRVPQKGKYDLVPSLHVNNEL